MLGEHTIYSNPYSDEYFPSEESMYAYIGDLTCMPGCHIWIFDDEINHEYFKCQTCKTYAFPPIPYQYTGREILKSLTEEDAATIS